MNATHTRKAIAITSKLEKLVQGVKITAFVVTMLILLSSVLWTGYSVKNYIDSHHFLWQSPVIFQTPLMIKEKHTEVLKNAPKPPLVSIGEAKEPQTEEEIVLATKNSKILYGVWTLESGRGVNKAGLHGKCLGEGGSNPYGYASQCFSSFQEVTAKVDAWFSKRFNEGYTEAEAMCYYNTGVRQPNCHYYMNYLAL